MVKILVIDDSKFARLKIGGIIKKGGYEVIEAENGKIGFEKAMSEKPDCIICDILMPVMDGFEFVEKFKAIGLNTPILTMTADIQKSTEDKMIRLGSFKVLKKPPKKEILLESIELALVNKES